MYERIIEIIVFVISELKQNKNISDIDINKLQALGYSSSEISTALSWLVDRVEITDKFFQDVEASDAGSFRVLHEAEKDLFTLGAWGEMIQLHNLGILTNENIENLIERAAMLGMHQIDTTQLKLYVANSIFNAQSSETHGSRVILHGNDSIN
jgi:uncharacterized protein Smg (DUF494 family)